MYFHSATLSAGEMFQPVESIRSRMPFGEHLDGDPIILDLMGSLEDYYQIPSQEKLESLLENYRIFRLNIGYVS